MQTQATLAKRPETTAAPRSGVLVVSGYGVQISVERKHLLIADGYPGDFRTVRLSRATSKLRRLVVLGHTGVISLEAMRWVHDIGAALVQIDADGTVVTVSTPAGLNDVRLRRAQALATSNGVGMTIARDLITQKLLAQARVLSEEVGATDAASTVVAVVDQVAATHTPAELMRVEAAGALTYWQAWSGLTLPFVQRDVERVPVHWRTFDGRISVLTGSPRRAADPINALLNYGYALLEVECRIALLAVGLDPGMGVLHADQPSRDSLALDLMEPLRPEVDRMVLGLVQTRRFATREFFETTDGNCRLVAPLPQELAAAVLPLLRSYVAPRAEALARALLAPAAHHRGEWSRLATPLTQSNRSAGRQRNGGASPRVVGSPTDQLRITPTCHNCGAATSSSRHRYCDECRPEHDREIVASFSVAGPAALAEARAAGRDPTATPEARAKLSERITARWREAAAWATHGYEKRDPEEFRRDILPRLQGLTLGALVDATGLSIRYCSRIRRGLRVPHPRHWEALAALGSVNTFSSPNGSNAPRLRRASIARRAVRTHS